MKAQRERNGRAVVVQAASIAVLAAGALVARRAGASEAATAGVLEVLVASVFATFVAMRLRRTGNPLPVAGAWGAVILLASVAPALLSMFPGRAIASVELRSSGDSLQLPDGASGHVRVVVSATLPENAFVAFTLTGAGATRDGTLARGVQWSGTGEDRRHQHEERTSVLLDGDVTAAERTLTLTRLAGDPAALRVRVFAPFVPAWVAALLTVLAMAALAARHGLKECEEAAVVAAFVSGCAGLLTGVIATPDSGLRAVVGGAIGGALVGVPLSAAVRAGRRPVSRWASRASRRAAMHTRREAR